MREGNATWVRIGDSVRAAPVTGAGEAASARRAYNGGTSIDPDITGELSEERSARVGSVEPSGAGPSQPQ